MKRVDSADRMNKTRHSRKGREHVLTDLATPVVGSFDALGRALVFERNGCVGVVTATFFSLGLAGAVVPRNANLDHRAVIF